MCRCDMKGPFEVSEIEGELREGRRQLKLEESVDINDWASLCKWGQHILDSKVLAVDL